MLPFPGTGQTGGEGRNAAQYGDPGVENGDCLVSCRAAMQDCHFA